MPFWKIKMKEEIKMPEPFDVHLETGKALFDREDPESKKLRDLRHAGQLVNFVNFYGDKSKITSDPNR